MADPSVSGVVVPGLHARSPKDILAAAARLRFPADLQKWSGAYRPQDLRAPEGAWPAAVDVQPGPTLISDVISGKVHERVHIVLLPTASGWEAPAYLRWGGWNACPPPEYHVAALRRWHEASGAVLVGVNGDTMNLRATTRPRDRAAARALAREQYGYCPDIVDQGVSTISALAAELMASDWWHLWWD
jgi:hypothetical protein